MPYAACRTPTIPNHLGILGILVFISFHLCYKMKVQPVEIENLCRGLEYHTSYRPQQTVSTLCLADRQNGCCNTHADVSATSWSLPLDFFVVENILLISRDPELKTATKTHYFHGFHLLLSKTSIWPSYPGTIPAGAQGEYPSSVFAKQPVTMDLAYRPRLAVWPTLPPNSISFYVLFQNESLKPFIFFPFFHVLDSGFNPASRTPFSVQKVRNSATMEFRWHGGAFSLILPHYSKSLLHLRFSNAPHFSLSHL